MPACGCSCRGPGRRDRVRLTAESVGAVAEYLLGLDGLPLAIELAAARGRLLSRRRCSTAGATAAAADGGARDLPARQQTLRPRSPGATSCSSPAEQRLFRRLGSLRQGLDARRGGGGARQVAPGPRHRRLRPACRRSIDREPGPVPSMDGGVRRAPLHRRWSTIRQGTRLERLESAGEVAGHAQGHHAGLRTWRWRKTPSSGAVRARGAWLGDACDRRTCANLRAAMD